MASDRIAAPNVYPLGHPLRKGAPAKAVEVPEPEKTEPKRAIPSKTPEAPAVVVLDDETPQGD